MTPGSAPWDIDCLHWICGDHDARFGRRNSRRLDTICYRRGRRNVARVEQMSFSLDYEEPAQAEDDPNLAMRGGIILFGRYSVRKGDGRRG